MGYDGFISYSHAADGRLAPMLQAGLQRLAKPWNRRRALHVFRDETGLSTNPHLWSAIEESLDDSEWFVLLASPASAESEWVDRELAHWLAAKSPDRILPVVTDGAWAWDAARGDFTPDSTAVPPSLRGVFAAEPRHLDLRWAHTEMQLDLRNSRFRAAVADLAAPMHGIPKDELEGEDVRQYRRTRRLARGAVSVLALLVVVAVTFGVVAFAERDRATKEQRHAQARGLSALGYARSRTQLDQALLLAAEGSRLEDTIDTRSGLISVLAASPGLLRFRHEFGDHVFVAAVSKNGARLATGGTDGSARVWDTSSGRAVTPKIRAHDAPIVALALSPDGHTLVTGSVDGEVGVFDADRGSRIRRLTPVASGRGRIMGIAFSPDGSEFAVTGDHTLFRWSMPDIAPLFEAWVGSESPVQDGLGFQGGSQGLVVIPSRDGGESITLGVTYSGDGHTILIGTETSVVEVDRLTGTVAASSIPVDGVAAENLVVPPTSEGPFGSANSLVAVGGSGGRVGLFDRSTHTRRPGPFFGHEGYVNSVAFNDDGSRLVTAGADGKVIVWDSSTGEQLHSPFVGHGGAVATAWFISSDCIGSVSATEFAIWTVRPQPTLESTTDDCRADNPLATAAWAFGDNAAVLPRRVIGISDERIAVSEAAGRVRLARPTGSSRSDREFRSSSNGSGPTAITPDGKTLAYLDVPIDPTTDIAAPEHLYIWRTGNARNLDTYSVRFAAGIVLSADGKQVALPKIDGTVDIIDTGVARRALRTLLTDTNGITFAAAFSPDGKRLVSGGQDAQAKLWDTRSGSLIATIGRQAAGPINDVAFSPDGQEIAVAAQNGEVTIYDASTRRQLGDPLAVTGTEPTKVAFSRDRTSLAVGSADGSVTLWDVGSGVLLGRALAGPPGRIDGLAFIRSDDVLISTSSAGPVTSRDLRPQSWRKSVCEIAGRNLTRAEWRQFMGDQSYRRTCLQWPSG